MSLVVSGIRVRYPNGVVALEDAGFTAATGQLTALIGPNGSGKSTLLRVAAGLLAASAGVAQWHGQRIDRMERSARARTLAFLPQSVQTVYRHTLREVVALGRHPHRVGLLARWSAQDERQVELALAATETTDLADRGFDELSGGERQRALIASLLVQEAELLLLDEPTTALDLHHQVHLMRLLTELAAAGRTVVCATHDLNLAAHFADQVILLCEGRVRAQGGVDRVMTAEYLREVYGDDIWVGEHPRGYGTAILPWVREGRDG